MFTAESEGERILKICQHLAKLWAGVECPVFYSRGRGTVALCGLSAIAEFLVQLTIIRSACLSNNGA